MNNHGVFIHVFCASLCISGSSMRHDTWCGCHRHHTTKSQMPPSSRVGSCQLSSSASPRLIHRPGSHLTSVTSSGAWPRQVDRHGGQLTSLTSPRLVATARRSSWQSAHVTGVVRRVATARRSTWQSASSRVALSLCCSDFL